MLVPIGALGLVFGSFVTALSYRLPRGENIAHGRSRCPACGHTLTAQDLVPVLSWVAQGGACRHCRAKIPWRYPAIELLMMSLFLGAAVWSRDVEHLILLLAMTPLMMTLAVIDLEHQRVPDVLLIPLAILALIWRWYDDQALLAGLGMAVVAVILGVGLDAVARRATKGPGLGMGDTKLFAIAAFALPLGPFLMFATLAGILGLGFGLLWQRREAARHFPFAPAILVSLWLALIAAGPILHQMTMLRLG
jgi:leader peptidase (prepilin peptidase)/N-methyltransferase